MQHNSSQNDTNTYPQRHMIPHHQNELFLSIRTSPDTQPWPATTDKSGYSHDSQNRIMSGNTDTHCILQLSIIDNTRDTTMSGDSPRRSCFVRMSCLIKHRILVTATLSSRLVSSRLLLLLLLLLFPFRLSIVAATSLAAPSVCSN